MTMDEQVVVEDEDEIFAEDKTKVLLVIDTQEIDW